MIPKSGGDYAYISEAFGPLPAFLYLWVALLVIVPTGNAITALTFAQYILQPLWANCNPPYEAIRLLAAVITSAKNRFTDTLNIALTSLEPLADQMFNIVVNRI
ncbi:Y+L amino acid transporter 2 [Homalodisca vitripennis]|nr:Y+L amino acid transporter 2 [Homalodisca vitripennis]